METVLTKIVDDKKIWLDVQKQTLPLDNFQQKITLSDRSLYDALNTAQTSFILECKKASPSKGLIREDFDLDFIAKTYAQHASAVSVLTDEKHFQGHIEFIPVVKRHLSQPVLCKDFIIDPYQVYLARYYEADAILLMLSVLDDPQYQALSELAASLKLDVLTEVSNQDELERAIALKAPIVGINNRNLRDLSIDLTRTQTLAKQLPKETVIVSESGIYNHHQVLKLSKHAHGFLIGSALMSEENLEIAIRKVIYGENKVCGLTRAQDAKAAFEAGAVYGGLIFVEGSKRYVLEESAQKVIDGAPLQYIGVFQNDTIDSISDKVNQLKLSGVQLHGQEDETFIQELKQKIPKHCLIFKAYAVKDILPVRIENADRHIYDCRVGDKTGGTGQAFDWRLLEDLSPQHKETTLIAGGVNPENIPQAIKYNCLGLDLNSGVEDAPGIKNKQKIMQAFNAIRNF